VHRRTVGNQLERNGIPGFPALAGQKDNSFAMEELFMHLLKSEKRAHEEGKFDIALVSLNRERAYANYKAFATYTFAIYDGPVRTHAEVIVEDGGVEIIEQKGKDAREAARLALERLLVTGCDPFEAPIFLQIPYQQAEFFSKYSSFLQKFPSVLS
jgi:hypothetical protein